MVITVKSINFGFYPYTDVLALYTQYFPESCEKIPQACYSGGIRTLKPNDNKNLWNKTYSSI